MKKYILVISLAIFFYSCATVEHIGGYQSLSGIDLRPYTEKDFLITPNDYAGKYKSIFIIDFVMMPEASYEPVNWVKGTPIKDWVYEPVDYSTAMNSIYEICLDMGANAIINFEISPNTDSYRDLKYPVVIVGTRISGMAISRED